MQTFKSKARAIAPDRTLRTFRAKFILSNYGNLLTTRLTKIFEAIADGKSNNEVAEAVGISVASVRSAHFKILTRFNCSDLKPEDPAPAERVKEPNWQTLERDSRKQDVWVLYTDGLNNREIMARVKITSGTLNTYLKELGLASRPAKRDIVGWLSIKDARRVCDHTERRVFERRLARGMTVGEMALTDGVRREIVLARMEKLGIQIPEKDLWTSLTGSGDRVPYNSAKDRNYAIAP